VWRDRRSAAPYRRTRSPAEVRRGRPAEIVELTNITDETVAGHKIDDAALENFVADANVVIALNAAFDRKFAERSWSLFEHKHWACSATGIEWQKWVWGRQATLPAYAIGILPRRAPSPRRLPCDPRNSDARASGHFDDRFVRSARPRPPQDASHLGRKSPVELKDALKRRRYRWNNGTDGRPRSWYIDVEQDKMPS
jgi:DNA polymerase III subunit epsilon